MNRRAFLSKLGAMAAAVVAPRIARVNGNRVVVVDKPIRIDRSNVFLNVHGVTLEPSRFFTSGGAAR